MDIIPSGGLLIIIIFALTGVYIIILFINWLELVLWQPPFYNLYKCLSPYRLAYKILHAWLYKCFFHSHHNSCGQCNNRHTGIIRISGRLRQLPYLYCYFNPIHFRHHMIHKNNIIFCIFNLFKCDFSWLCRIYMHL